MILTSMWERGWQEMVLVTHVKVDGWKEGENLECKLFSDEFVVGYNESVRGN